MIILNNKGELIFSFSWQRLSDKILKALILNRAYNGYVYYNTLEDKDAVYLSFSEFKEFDLWKIKFSFQIYLERLCNVGHLGMSPNNKTLFKFWRRKKK